MKNLRVKVYNDIKKRRAVHFELREKRRKKNSQIKEVEAELRVLS